MLHRLIWISNIAAAIGLVFSLMAAVISPVSLWWLTLFGLAFEVFLLLNLAFTLYWIIIRKRKFLLSFILVVMSIGKIFGIIQFHPFKTSEVTLEKEGFHRIMSFNVRLFDLYNWFHNKETRGKIFKFLSDTPNDIICFQEYYSSDNPKNEFNNEDILKEILNAKYTHIEYTVTLRDVDHWGIATYSKYPIIKKRSVHFSKKGGSIFIYSDIKINEDTIRVFNTHLESMRFGWKDYHFIENINKDDVEQDEIAGSLNILRRLKRASIVRAQQIQVMKDSVNASPYPVVICGDFNDTPSSFTYAHISKNLKDAYKESGNGPGKTYTGPFPSFRIDYIFHDKRFDSNGYSTIKEKLSDHYPISCYFKLK